jgi:hypothetical protein
LTFKLEINKKIKDLETITKTKRFGNSWDPKIWLYYLAGSTLISKRKEDYKNESFPNERPRERRKWGLTVYSQIILWVQPLVKDRPTFPFLGFYSWDVTKLEKLEKLLGNPEMTIMQHPPNEKTLIRFRNYITGLHKPRIAN